MKLWAYIDSNGCQVVDCYDYSPDLGMRTQTHKIMISPNGVISQQGRDCARYLSAFAR